MPGHRDSRSDDALRNAQTHRGSAATLDRAGLTFGAARFTMHQIAVGPDARRGVRVGRGMEGESMTQSGLARRFALLAAVTSGFALAAAGQAGARPVSPPVEPDDFTAHFHITGFPHQPVRLGDLQEDYTNRRSRFDVSDRSGLISAVFVFYDKFRSYTYVPASNGCTEQSVSATMQPAFGWLASATGAGPNHWQATPASSFFTPGNDLANIFGLLGDASTAGPVDLTLDNSGSQAPKALAVQSAYRLKVTDFVPGAPSANEFNLPAICVT